MTEIAGIPKVDVAVCLIKHDDRILAVFNDKWGMFTLPMTKLRQWEDRNMVPNERAEEPVDAAIRASAEWLGKTSTVAPAFLNKIGEYSQSDRDGKLKRYHFHVFEVSIDNPVGATAMHTSEWLTFAQLTDEDRRPISETARFILHKLNDPNM